MKKLFLFLMLLLVTSVVSAHTITLNSGRKLTVIIDKVTTDLIYYHTQSNSTVRTLSQSKVKAISKEPLQPKYENEVTQDTLPEVSLNETVAPKIEMKGRHVFVNGNKVDYDEVAKEMFYVCPESSKIASKVYSLNDSRHNVLGGYLISTAILGYGLITKHSAGYLDSPIRTEEEQKEYDSDISKGNTLIWISCGLYGAFTAYLGYTYLHPYVVMRRSVNMYNSRTIKKSEISFVPYIGVNKIGFAINF